MLPRADRRSVTSVADVSINDLNPDAAGNVSDVTLNVLHDDVGPANATLQVLIIITASVLTNML